jgi:hypothetical protein
MIVFDFVSHENYPEDQYIAESVVLCFDNKFRVTYIRKKMQSGAMFWAEISVSVMKNGEKKYLKSFSHDSNFLIEDVKTFLDGRQWETKGNYSEKAKNSDQAPF